MFRGALTAFCLIFAAPFVFAASPATITPQQIHELAQSRAWLKLVHYVNPWLGRLASQADGPSFFLAPQGKTNPVAELTATIEAFAAAAARHSDHTDQQAPCRFPARWLWLKQQMPNETQTWQQAVCPRYDHFRQALNPHSATLVFSSYYLNSPSSTFGHTFLRINKQTAPGQSHYDLLDYGLNYAASADTSNPLVYAYKGMFGGFKGEFTNVPYYYKVQEYNDSESRDIWEYDLNLSPDEVQMVVAHFWELGQTFFYYFYLTQNCSYHMLTVLEAAAPRLHLVDQTAFYVIPADTVRALFANPGFVQGLHYRPSKRTRFVTRLATLSSDERALLSQWLHFEDTQLEQQKALLATSHLPVEAKARTLDAAIDYFDFRHFQALALNESHIREIKQNLLLARSELGPSDELNVPMPQEEIPHLGHPSSRASAAWSRLSGQRNSLLLDQRFALHDLLDARVGYPRDAGIEFLHLQGRLLWSDLDPQKTQMRIEQLYLFQVQSLTPYQPFLRNISWQGRIGAERVTDASCDECLSGVAGGSAGYTLSLLSSHPLFLTTLLDTEISTSDQYDSRWKLAVGPSLLLRWLPTPQIAVQTSLIYHHLLWVNSPDTTRLVAEARYGWAASWGIGSKFMTESTFWEQQLSLFYYY
jgi:hypothetical protein